MKQIVLSAVPLLAALLTSCAPSGPSYRVYISNEGSGDLTIIDPEKNIVVAGYGECGPGYIPIDRAWEENDGNLSDWCWIDPGSEKKLRGAIEKALKKD